MQEEDFFLNMLHCIDVYLCTSIQYFLELLNIVIFTGVVHNLILKQL